MFGMTAIVKGMFWGAAAVEPIMQVLGLGSVLAAWNIAKKPDIYDDFFIRSEQKTEQKTEPKIEPKTKQKTEPKTEQKTKQKSKRDIEKEKYIDYAEYIYDKYDIKKPVY